MIDGRGVSVTVADRSDLMFYEKIFINSVKDIRYGQTEISAQKTMGEIMNLLEKHKCDEILTRSSRESGAKQIAFIYQDNPYMITIPLVYVGENKVLHDKIGVRLVKYYLEIILDWAKHRVVDLQNLLMSQRMVQIDGKNYTMMDVMNKMPAGKLLESFAETPQLTDGDE